MKKVLKWTGIVLGSLVVLLLIAGLTLSFRGGGILDQTYEAPAPVITSVPSDSATVAYGAHLASINACRECHGEQLAGQVLIDAPPFLVVAPNLTPGQGGIGQAYTEADWNRAIRHGVSPDGKAVLIMPSKAFHQLSDDDAVALIAYLKTLPAVDNTLPATEVRLLGRILAGVGEIDPGEFVVLEPARASAPEPGPTEAYGAYLTGITCVYCHGKDLRGGPSPDPNIFSPDLVAAAAWSEADFINTMRTGVRPSGAEMNPEAMPWGAFRHMTDDELTAIHAYLKTLPS